MRYKYTITLLALLVAVPLTAQDLTFKVKRINNNTGVAQEVCMDKGGPDENCKPLGVDEHAIIVIAPKNDFRDVQDAVAAVYGYEDTILDENGDPIPNPVSERKFFHQRIVKRFVKWVNKAARQEYDNAAPADRGEVIDSE